MTSYRKSQLGRKKGSFSSNFWFFGFWRWVVIALACALATFAFSTVTNPNRARKSRKPLTSVSLQIINGSGIAKAAEKLRASFLSGDDCLMYDILETSNSKNESFEKTVVIDRQSQSGKISEKAKKVALHLGINPQEVIALALDDNIFDIEVTVVAGKDYGKYVDRLKKIKEASL